MILKGGCYRTKGRVSTKSHTEGKYALHMRNPAYGVEWRGTRLVLVDDGDIDVVIFPRRVVR